MATFMIKDGNFKVSIDRPVENITDHVWSCFYLLLGATCDPINLCESFREVADEIEGAWFDASD